MDVIVGHDVVFLRAISVPILLGFGLQIENVARRRPENHGVIGRGNADVAVARAWIVHKRNFGGTLSQFNHLAMFHAFF